MSHLSRASRALIPSFALVAVFLAAGCDGSSATDSITVNDIRALAADVSQTLGQQSGIHVSGRGSVRASPDLAVVTAGIDVLGPTVVEANMDAAEAMAQVINALDEHGVRGADVQTLYFNIQPEYRYDGVLRKAVLTGYRVTNTVTARVRNLDTVGQIVDAVVVTAGDAARVQSIQFSVEDVAELEREARSLAVADARARAGQLASLAGAEVGEPLFLSESLGSTYPPTYRDAEASGGSATPISPGQVEVQVTVQAVFELR